MLTDHRTSSRRGIRYKQYALPAPLPNDSIELGRANRNDDADRPQEFASEVEFPRHRAARHDIFDPKS
ncbi:MAG: hypothetical protein M3Y35_15395 [Actinomycetota bacterium]|nr:hypothetical protein [Actinomycetota bacterium]